jgi:hypothetical protein
MVAMQGGRRKVASGNKKWPELGVRRMSRTEKKELKRRLHSEDRGLEVMHPDAAGIDIGNESHFVAVPPGRTERPVQEFGATQKPA